MTAPTFFPREVQRAISDVEREVERDGNATQGAGRLADELRRWERAWRRGETRLVVQCADKPNGEDGL